jgi:hypothetical protein
VEFPEDVPEQSEGLAWKFSCFNVLLSSGPGLVEWVAPTCRKKDFTTRILAQQLVRDFKLKTFS